MFRTKIGLVLGLMLFTANVSALTIKGTLITVHQGDTFTIKSVSSDEKLYKVRLSDIDTPELKQPFGLKAKEFTETQVIDLEIQVEYSTTDFYGRLIGSVLLPQGKILNEELVRNGFAWHYRVRPLSSATLERLQYEAWRKKLGFWIDPSPIPPWKFRRGKIVSAPPVKENQMDYDLILNYGIIGDPKTKIYWWPDCKDYPEKKEKNIIFGYKQLAEDMGYRSSSGCMN
jgi:endonuclease YncB( thermonuclease family)